MRIVHLILAHNNPEQLECLVRRLLYQDDTVYIHLDKKANQDDFCLLQAYPQVHFIQNRTHVKWGSYSIVEATINSFKEILQLAGRFDFINMLSGNDYPLQTPAQIHHCLEEHPGRAFMHFLPMHTEWQEALPRITRYHLTNYRFPGSYKLESLINKLMPERKMPGGLVPVGRSQWFTISMPCLNYILDYWQAHPDLQRFIKFTWAPDEFIFQTILYNSPLKDCMINDNLRHMDWSGGGVSPKTFTAEDKGQLLASDKLFARKFDLKKHPEIMELIDQKLSASIPLASAS